MSILSNQIHSVWQFSLLPFLLFFVLAIYYLQTRNTHATWLRIVQFHFCCFIFSPFTMEYNEYKIFLFYPRSECGVFVWNNKMSTIQFHEWHLPWKNMKILHCDSETTWPTHMFLYFRINCQHSSPTSPILLRSTWAHYFPPFE